MNLQRNHRALAIAAWLAAAGAIGGCGGPVVNAEAPVPQTVAASPAASPAAPAPKAPPSQAVVKPASPAAAAPPAPAATASDDDLVAGAPVPFKTAIGRAGAELLAKAQARLGGEPRALVIDPLIDANTGAQTVSTVSMGEQLSAIVRERHKAWTVEPLTRKSLDQQPLLMIGTLTPVNVAPAVDTPPDAFRVWLTLIDLRTGRVVAKQLDRSTVDSVDPSPLKFYSDSPTWAKDATVLGYINSCQVNTRTGDPADPDYLKRLPAAAVVNEATMAYDDGKIAKARDLYRQARAIADPGDLRVLNGLYLTNWQLGQREAAKQEFDRLVDSGLELRQLPLKLLFKPATTAFEQIGDLPEQYRVWISSLANQAGKASVCVKIVGHTTRTGDAHKNVILSRRRAETVQKMLTRDNRALGARLSATGVGSREALVGLGTDDLRDALDRRVEFRVVDCV
ncbi:MAG: OmpA family protein [Burkholderiales bacterium]|nr:OmpA family protein [Burkholderiales bacterium]MDE2452061.1 OmpA family protein [Burkholderiales bacterium]